MTEGQKSGPSEDEYQGQISSIQQIFAEYLGRIWKNWLPPLVNLFQDLGGYFLV